MPQAVQPKHNRFSLRLHKSSRKSSDGRGRHPGLSISHAPTSPTQSVTSFALSPPNSPTSSVSPSGTRPHATPSVCMDATSPQYNEPVPPTKNELDAKEKAKLLKKARKLSRVFGELPDFEGSINPTKPTHVHRRSSSSTSVPFESSGIKRHILRSPSQAELRSRPSLPQIKELVQAPHRSHALDASSHNSSVSISRVPSRSPSVSSEDLSDASVLSLRPVSKLTPEQLRRAKMAKLTRHLGENIPSELVTCSARNTSIMEVPPRNPVVRHRKSLDALSPPGNRKSLNKRRSYSHQHSGRPPTNESVGFRERYEENFGDAGKFSVRRAAPTVERVVGTSGLFGRDFSREFSWSVEEREQSHNIGTVSSPVASVPSVKPRIRSSSANTSLPDQSINLFTEESRNDSESSIPSLKTHRRHGFARLTNFFGLVYRDISPSTQPSDNDQHGTSVQMQGRRFWGIGDSRQEMQDVEMQEVIDKLRTMRAE